MPTQCPVVFYVSAQSRVAMARATSLAFLLLATQPFGVRAEVPTPSRPALVARRAARLHSSRLGRAELTAAAGRSETWRARVLEWGDTHASAAWFPCLLGFIGFMDPFTLCGFLVTPLLTLGLCVADRSWAFVLCAAVWLGCLAGNLAFVALIGRLGLAAKFTGSPHLATAAELLQRHGPMAGVVNTNPGPNPDPNPSPSPSPNPDPDPDRNPNPNPNPNANPNPSANQVNTILPLPTVPLMVAAHALQVRVRVRVDLTQGKG